VLQLVLVYCFLSMSDYLVWLHFNTMNANETMLDTSPGAHTAMLLGGTVVALLVFNGWMASRRTPAAPGR
jgi:hypothetical protein